MPTYEYRCPDGHLFDRRAKMSEAAAELECPVCGKIATRQLSGGAALVFKGSGFYLTDYGKNAHRGTAPETANSGKNRESSEGGDSKSGDKPGDSKSGDKSGDSKSSDKSGDTKSSESKSADAKSSDKKSSDTKSSETKSAESKPSDKSGGSGASTSAPPKKSDS